MAFTVVCSEIGVLFCFAKTQLRKIFWLWEGMEAAHPQVISCYKECCHSRHHRVMKRVFGYSTHLSESNMRPIYAFQLPFHLVPFILITSGASFHLTIWNSQIPRLEQLLFLQVIQSPPLLTELAEGSLDCWIQRLLLSLSTSLVLWTTPLPFTSRQTLCGSHSVSSTC